jgi:DNA-directed RNA polymerase I, II, and III subunit RPABC2
MKNLEIIALYSIMNDDEYISDAESETAQKKKKDDDDVDVDDDDDDDDDDDEVDDDVDDDDDEDADDVDYNVDPKLATDLLMSDDDGDGEDEDDLDENYLQKLDSDMNKDIIKEHHPELLTHNTEEVDTACLIVRDEYGDIVDPLHRTVPFVTRYERARVLGERAKQINSGAQPFVPIDTTLIDGYLIALQEFEQKKIPFIIRRPLPNGNSEYWRLSDLDII